MKQIIFTWSLLLFYSLTVIAQNSDPVLFSVNNVPVNVSEFKYIYSKTNGAKADFSKASLSEYLDLYTKFKLKVQRAKDLRMDTIPSLKSELDNYRRQLADSYLIDREVTDRLIDEAYNRQQEDISISHILIALPQNATPVDTLKAFNKATDLASQIKNGAKFSNLIAQSDDTISKKKDGTLGFVNAMLPSGYYDLETAIYNTPKGSTSDVVRSPQGYHIIRVNEKRPARGEMEVSHILIRKDKNNPKSELTHIRIDSIYAALKGGADFASLAKTISQDRSSANKGGYVGFIGINLYEPSFEDAVFALQKDGDYSAPVESSVGWHIIKRLGKRGTESFEKAKPRLKTKITQDSRFEQARNAMVARIKKDANYSDSAKGYEQFVNSTDSTFLTYKWQTPTSELPDATELFRFGKNNIYSINDFYEFLKKNSRKRINYGATNTNRNDAIKSLFNDFVAESALKNEEKNLDAKYPEFKSLLREYEEGILLFEVTKNNVWDKASQDSVGLAAFYPTVADKYKWDERVVTSYYTVQNAQDTVTLEKIRKYAIKKTPEKVLKKFNKKGVNVVSVQDKTFEKGKNEALNKMKWEVGTLSYNEKNMQANTTSFLKIEKLLPITNKTLAEARGYVVADYQDYLEKEWVKSLQNAYKVNVNQKVFDSLVK